MLAERLRGVRAVVTGRSREVRFHISVIVYTRRFPEGVTPSSPIHAKPIMPGNAGR